MRRIALFGPVVDDTALTFGPRAVPLSVLDLAPVPDGGTAGDALRATIDLARHAERLGFRRFWVAEHHNMPGIASSAPSVLIGHIADATTTMRVGSGGVMLPNHVSLVVAEQFGSWRRSTPAGSTWASAARRPGRYCRRGPMRPVDRHVTAGRQWCSSTRPGPTTCSGSVSVSDFQPPALAAGAASEPEPRPAAAP